MLSQMPVFKASMMAVLLFYKYSTGYHDKTYQKLTQSTETKRDVTASKP